MEGVAKKSYCGWNPNSVAIGIKNSTSTGFGSKQWKFQNLLIWSHSDGKDKQLVMFKVPSTKVNKVAMIPSATVEHDDKQPVMFKLRCS